nr:hypothetical protein BaRGS_003141 [Batillaria attramentaria]
MGQNNSTDLQTRSAPTTPRGKPTPPRPATPPEIPKIPNYAVPENRVLPVEAAGLLNKRQLLRPVSQELSKFHPEFADIFQYEEDRHDMSMVDPDLRSHRSGGSTGDEKENMMMTKEAGSLGTSPTRLVQNGGIHSSRYSHVLANGELKPNNIELSRSQSLQEKRSNGRVLNGVVPHGNAHVSANPNGEENERGRSGSRGGGGGGGVLRTNSLDRSTSSPNKTRAHKRYPSATNSLANENSVIPEDPREHLYTHWRQDPFSNPIPQVTSLPVKNSFDVDYSLNLTYAQLAEFRRQKRISDLEDRTGKKLSELNAELSQKSTLPVSPFDRNNYQPSQPSASSGTSSEIGVSKSKKRRAPPPPTANGGQDKGRRDSSPGRLSLDVEPPADYDLDDPSPRGEIVSPWKTSLQRKDSTASKSSTNSKGPAPKPPPPAPPAPSTPSSFTPAPSVTQSLPRSASTKPPATSPSSGTLPSKGSSAVSAASARLIAQAKAELEALKKLEILLKEKDSEVKDDKGESSETKVEGGSGVKSEGAEETEKGATESTGAPDVSESANKDQNQQQNQTKSEGDDSSMSISLDSENQDAVIKPPEAEKPNGPRRLSSLLQHDIVLAAQARSMKGQVKPKSPVQHKRPKDAHEMFREELAKAATAREERVKSTDTDKETQAATSPPAEDSTANEAVVFKSDLVKVKRKSAVNEVSSSPAKPAAASSSNGPSSPTSSESAPMQAKAGVSKSESDLLSVQKPVSRIPASAASRQRAPDDEPAGESFGLRKAVSQNGVLDLSDDEAEVSARAKSSSDIPSSRTFPDDWKPEDDLDSDDDMMDDMTYSRSSAALEASDGFKSSIIPGRLDDLKSAKRKSKSARKESSSTDERKYGSIRKFRKSVHESVRNAFGSISRASGKLLRRGKSHDFGLDDVEGRSYRVSKDEDAFRKPNGVEAALAVNGHVTDDDDSDLEAFYDAADSVEDPPAAGRTDQQVKMMKRAGVAYVGRKGQIVVLPEFETVPVDEAGNVLGEKDEDEGHAPRIYRKKKKKFTYESTVRRQEKDRVAERMVEEIKEKERQIEFERRKQHDMEREFQRLRDMETQERLQRLQTAQLQQQMNLLQQQQQMNSTLTSQFMQTSAPLHPHQRYGVPDYATGPTGVYTTAAGMGGVGGPIPPVNMSSYSMQSAPFVAPTSTGTATVGGYDVNYLSNYMRMMGIQPPTTQQQWAYLLSSVTGLGSTSGISPLMDPSSKGQGLIVSAGGPDLSHLFAPKTSSAYADSSALVAQKSSLMNLFSSGQVPQVPQVPQVLQVDGSLAAATSLSAPMQTPVGVTVDHPPKTAAGSASARPKSMTEAASGLPKDRTNPLYFSSDEDESPGKRSNHAGKNSRNSGKGKRRPVSAALPSLGQSNVYRDVTLREEAAVTRVQVPDYRDTSVYVVDSDADGDDDSSGDESVDDVAMVKDLYDSVLKEADDIEKQNGVHVTVSDSRRILNK